MDTPLVLGGGIAGIAAAAALADAGLRPLLVESRPYLGGRVRSFIHQASGDEIDNGQHLMMGCYRHTFRLLELLGTRGLVELQPTLQVEFRDPDGSSERLVSPPLPPPLNVLAGMLALRRLSLGERLSLMRVGLAAKLSDANDRETVREYLNRHGQSERAQRRLWDPIVIATLNTPPERASAQIFVRVMRLAFLGNRTDSQIAFPRVGLSQLLDPARSFIERRGGRVMLGASVTAIIPCVDGYKVEVKGQGSIASRHVVSAIPHAMLRSLWQRGTGPVETLPTWLVDPLPISPIVSLYLWFDRELGAVPEFGAMLGTATQWMFNRRRISSARNERYPGLLSCTISAAFEEAVTGTEHVIETAERELRAAFPEIGAARLLDALVIKEKQATFAATPEAERRRPRTQTEYPGYFLAGDWTATGLPGTIEGGARSGFAAAQRLLKQLR